MYEYFKKINLEIGSYFYHTALLDTPVYGIKCGFGPCLANHYSDDEWTEFHLNICQYEGKTLNDLIKEMDYWTNRLVEYCLDLKIDDKSKIENPVEIVLNNGRKAVIENGILVSISYFENNEPVHLSISPTNPNVEDVWFYDVAFGVLDARKMLEIK